MIDGIRTIITCNSIWKLDVHRRCFVRFPRAEAPAADNLIPYTCDWEPYSSLERYEDRVIVRRPVPPGHGALRMTGPIEWDDLKADDFGAKDADLEPLQVEPDDRGAS